MNFLQAGKISALFNLQNRLEYFSKLFKTIQEEIGAGKISVSDYIFSGSFKTFQEF
jgi:hypothetical protein